MADEVNATASDETNEAAANRHCEPTGRANARPMAGSAKQSSDAQADWFASSQELLAMTAFIDYVPVDFQSKAAVRNHDTAKIALSSVIASEARQSSDARADWIASSQELLAMTGLMDHVAVGLQSKAAGPEKCH